MSIVFQNPGLVDLDAITTFGVNVKDSDSPIGYFGTGFKYAIAVILRNGGRIDLYRGTRHFNFEAGSKTIRGKDFDVIWLFEHGEPGEDTQCRQLGFTTELGKNWEPWMAFRELYCNALDEGGRTTKLEGPPEVFIGDDYTTIIVNWDKFDEVYANRQQYFLEKREPLARGQEIEVVAHGPTRHCFYRGIRAHQCSPEYLYNFVYNILKSTQLTEDRTLAYAPESIIRDFYLRDCENEELLTEALKAPKSTHEHRLNFDVPWIPASQTFLDVTERLHSRRELTNDSAIVRLRKERAGAAEPPALDLDDIDAIRLRKAIAFCRGLGYQVDAYPIIVTESLGRGILGEADMKSQKIFLAKEVFTMGTKQVAQTLLEEFIHLRYGLHDESRGMQEHLFGAVISLGERVLKEAL